MDSNPHNLKTVDEKPSGYLDADEFIAFCNRKKLLLKEKIIFLVFAKIMILK